MNNRNYQFMAEIDISVSKLLGFQTFAKSLRVSVSVSENLVSEKKSWFRFRKNLVSEKSIGFGEFGLGKKVSFSENLVSEKSIGFSFRKFGFRKKSRYRFRSTFW